MDKLKPPIFEDIANELLDSLKHDDLFTPDLVQQIANLFASGDIAVPVEVLKTLDGELSENPQH